MTCNDCKQRHICTRSLPPEECSIFIRERDYRIGYVKGIAAMANRLMTYYTSLPLPKIQPAAVEYHIKLLAEELLEEGE